MYAFYFKQHSTLLDDKRGMNAKILHGFQWISAHASRAAELQQVPKTSPRDSESAKNNFQLLEENGAVSQGSGITVSPPPNLPRFCYVATALAITAVFHELEEKEPEIPWQQIYWSDSLLLNVVTWWSTVVIGVFTVMACSSNLHDYPPPPPAPNEQRPKREAPFKIKHGHPPEGGQERVRYWCGPNGYGPVPQHIVRPVPELPQMWVPQLAPVYEFVDKHPYTLPLVATAAVVLSTVEIPVWLLGSATLVLAGAASG